MWRFVLLARSEQVRYLLSPEERRGNAYSVEFQENVAYLQHRDPNFNLSEIKINGLSTPFIQRNNGEDTLVDEMETQGFKVLSSQSVSVQNPKDMEMDLHITPHNTFGVNGGNCSNKQNLYSQQFPAFYEFPGNTYHCINEREISKEREAVFRRLSPKEGAGRNENFPGRSDYAGWPFQRPLCHTVVAKEPQGNENVQGVGANEISQSSDLATLSPYLDVKEEVCPEESEPPIAGDPGLMNMKQLTTKNLGLPGTSQFQEDAL